MSREGSLSRIFPAVAAVGLAALGFVAWRHGPPMPHPARFAAGAAVAAGLGGYLLTRGFRRACQISSAPVAEAARWILVLAVAAAAVSPYATRRLVGAGDARHYMQQLEDALEQAHHGVFPVLIGQGDFSLDGDFHPLRTAPFFQYAGMAVDAVAGPGNLGAPGTMNLLIAGSLVIAALGTYLAALRIGGEPNAWLAALLAAAVALSPGILALAYDGDMIASWMAVPFLPMFFYGLWRAASDPPASRGWVIASVGLAGAWLAHAPIALWLMPLFALVALRPRRDVGEWRGEIRIAVGAGAIALVLSIYVFASVVVLDVPADPNLARAIQAGAIMDSLRAGWANTWKIVEPTGSNLLYNLQLSPILWVACLAGVALAPRRLANPFVLYFVLLVALLVPSPLADWAWKHLPGSVVGLTDKWPGQRFYPILSALAPFLFLGAAAHRPLNRKARQIALWALAAGCLAGAVDAAKFLRRGQTVTLPDELTTRFTMGTNAVQSRYSPEYYGRVSRYFAEAPVSAELSTRLLAADTLAVSLTDRDALRAATGAVMYALQADGAIAGHIPLAKGQRYLFELNLGAKPPDGVLELQGRTLYRQYTLTTTSEPLAFRDRERELPSFLVWSGDGEADSATAHFFMLKPTDRVPAGAVLRVIPVDEPALPIKVRGLVPLTVTARAPVDGWLETPRIFTEGYRAVVDGAPAEVSRSPDGLAMIPVARGTHEIVLRYAGTSTLLASFWITAIALGILIAIVLLPPVGAWWKARESRFVLHLAWVPVLIALAGGATVVAQRLKDASATHGLAEEGSRSALRAVFPADGTGRREIVATALTTEGTITVVAEYVDGQNVRFEFGRDGVPASRSAPVYFNYVMPHDIEILWGSAPAAGGPPVWRVVVDHRIVLDGLKPGTGARPVAAPGPFSGRLRRVDG